MARNTMLALIGVATALGTGAAAVADASDNGMFYAAGAGIVSMFLAAAATRND